MTSINRGPDQRQQVTTLAVLIAQMVAREPAFRKTLIASFPELRAAPVEPEQGVEGATVREKVGPPKAVAPLEEERWVRPKRACELLDIGTTTLYARLNEGAWVTKKIGGCRLIKLSSIT